MRFLVSQIRDAKVVEQEETVSAQDLIGTPPAFVTFGHPITSKIQAKMTRDGEIVLSGKVSTVITYQCGRCLDVFEKPVTLDYDQVVTGEEINDLEIDIDKDIRETLLIDLPVRALCRENCKGICAFCGKNRNTTDCRCDDAPSDPRWSALKEFPFRKKS